MSKSEISSATNSYRELQPQFLLSRAMPFAQRLEEKAVRVCEAWSFAKHGRRAKSKATIALSAIKLLLAVTLCLKVGCFSVYAIPVKEATAPKRFVDWCLNQAQLPFQTRHTVDVLLKIAGTQDCARADNILSNFTSLDLSLNQITDINPLSSLTKLTKLDLRSNQITDIKPLSSLTNLTDLDLRHNQITDIKPLSFLTNLIALELSSNQITDPKPLSSLTNLTDLSLINNQIADIKPLSSLTNLTFLYLFSNQITDIKPLFSLTKLTNLDLSFNQTLTNKTCPVQPESICKF